MTHWISLTLLGWLVFGFIISVVAGTLLLPLLRRFGVRQHAYEDAPQTHQIKSGTPTMGGLVFVVVFLLLFAILHRVPLLGPLTFLILACAAIGAFDDYLGIRHGANRGLRARTKLLATALIAVIFMREVALWPIFPKEVLFHAGSFVLKSPEWLWLILGVLAITGTIHAVNLTDGLDGLATGTIVPPLALFAIVGGQLHAPSASIPAAAGVGACAGFLIFNRYPARLFMGDTGSLALGALLAGVAILTGEMLLLILAGGVFVAEALSVMAQVTYFKATNGKRIFRMTPLHHHFELLGWPETAISMRFWLASFVCSLLGWAIVR